MYFDMGGSMTHIEQYILHVIYSYKGTYMDPMREVGYRSSGAYI